MIHLNKKQVSFVVISMKFKCFKFMFFSRAGRGGPKIHKFPNFKCSQIQSTAVAQTVNYSEFSLQTCAAQVMAKKHTTGKQICSMEKVIASVRQ